MLLEVLMYYQGKEHDGKEKKKGENERVKKIYIYKNNVNKNNKRKMVEYLFFSGKRKMELPTLEIYLFPAK